MSSRTLQLRQYHLPLIFAVKVHKLLGCREDFSQKSLVWQALEVSKDNEEKSPTETAHFVIIIPVPMRAMS